MTDWLLSTLVATSGLTLLVLLVREPVRKRFGSRVTYSLWLIPAARLFMPTLTRTVERRIPAVPPFQPIADPLVRESLWMARVAPPEPSLLDRMGGWPTLVVILWFAVAAGLFLTRMIAFYRDRRTILASSTCVDRVGSVRIVRSPEIASPVALGILDRLIAVPSDFERLYDARERRLVLEHELAHHRSGDLVANLFAFVLLCLQWFNPLAWVAHAAFRFDQEAACDARVLDRAAAADRGDYGRAIAKAASGRALLFASALDRRNTLKRRLQSMLRNPNPNRRIIGRVIVVSAVAFALPLTASRAVDYVDVPSPVTSARAATAAPQVIPTAAPQGARPSAVEQAPAPQVVDAAVSSAAERPLRLTMAAAAPKAMPPTQVAAGGVAIAAPAASRPRASLHDERDNLTISGDMVTIDGVTKRWEDLTPAEKARVRSAVAKANQALAGVHIDQARIAQDLAHIPNQAQMAQLQQQLAQTQVRVAQSADAARRSVAAVDWPRVARSMDDARRAVAAVDWQRINQSFADAKRSLGVVDQAKIAESVARAAQSMTAAKAELARIQARIDADPNH